MREDVASWVWIGWWSVRVFCERENLLVTVAEDSEIGSDGDVGESESEVVVILGVVARQGSGCFTLCAGGFVHEDEAFGVGETGPFRAGLEIELQIGRAGEQDVDAGDGGN